MSEQSLIRRLVEAEETLQAICKGEVDAVVVTGPAGDQVYTLESPDQPFRVFVERMQEGALTLSEDGAIVYCNRFFADLVQRPLEQVRGSRLQAFVAEDALAHFQALLATAETGAVHGECRLIAADGTQHPVQLAFNRLPDERTRMYGVVVTDLAERERVRALEAERKAAEDASAARDQFLAVVSHELRTPLHAILGWTQLLLRRGDVPGNIQRGLEVIERSAWSQAQLIDDLLDVSRVLAGKLRLERQPIDLNEIVAAAIQSVQPKAQDKNIHLTSDLLGRPVKINGDPERIQQVIWNLLSNAVKFTPEGGEVQVWLGLRGGLAEVRVSDNGMGMSPTFLPQIFELFHQIESGTTRRSGGLGLGLAIVKNLTELHGGTVEAYSEGEGKGTSFTVRLPLLAAEGRTIEPATSGYVPGAQALKGLCLLLVEDEEGARDVLVQLLESAGATVFSAATARDALELLDEEESIDVLISDIGLPEMDGYELIRRIRASGRSGRDLPAVALTAFAGSQDRRTAVLAGYQVHMPKPLKQDELVAVIANLGGVG